MTDTFETSNPQPFDSLGLFTYLRTYARRHDENDPNSTVESWKECITRIVNATNSQLNVGFSKDEKQELFDLLYNLKCSVAGRFLWQLGTRTVDNLGLMSLQNCAFTVCDEPVKPFVWVMNFLMLGAGCGYRISQEDVAKFPRIQSAVITRKDTKDADFVVPDSRQGWVKLLGKVMKSHFYSGAGFSYSCSLLRSKGAPIKSFGGLSSGPEVLCEGIAKINEILNKYAGTKITSVICLDIMNIIGKIVVSGNVRRCLPKGSFVHTDTGLVAIENVEIGCNVLTSNGYNRVSNKFVQGKQQLVTITTQDGEFKCTQNHKMAVLTSPNDYIWKEASMLSSGDRLMSSRMITSGIHTKLPEWSYEYTKCSTTCKPIVVPELDSNMAWFIGLFQGDGYTYPNYDENGFNSYVSLVFGLNEYDIAEKAQQQLQRFGETLSVTLKKRNGENSYMVHCQSKQLAWYFDKNVKQAKTVIRAPEYILKSTPEIRLAYISGITDSDGCVTNRPIQVVSTVYEDFAKDIQNILYSCGIESRFVRCSDTLENRKGWQRQYKVNLITLRSQKEFSEIPTLIKTLKVNSKSQNGNGFPSSFIDNSKIKRKYGLYGNQQLNIDSYNACINNTDLWCPVEVISVCEGGEDDTYDIEVEDVHEFFCNGYLTHNSAQIALGDATDKEYLQAKRWDLGNVPNWRCYSNNSVICNDINEIIENDDFWQGYNGNGEPYGLINLKLSRSCGRLGETQYPDPTVQGYNPCVAGDTIIFTEFGPKKVKEILNQKLRVYVDGELYPTTCGFFSTGVQQLYKLTTKEGFTLRATANHLIMTPSGKWVTVSSLRQGDEVKLHEHTIQNYYEDDDNDYEVENVQLCILRKGQVYIENKDGLLEQRLGENNPFYATVASVTPDSIEEVFDCTVPDIHAFDANGFYVHNCAEQSLADKETCCLAEVYLPNISSFEELKKCVSYLYRVCKHSLTLPCADSRETQEIVHKNMRMGIGMTGVLQASEEQREWLKPCYEFLRTFDRIYSQFENFPTSVKLTTCKPSGTLSILGKCTSGIHPGFAQYYIRRIRVASESKLINLAKEHGYYVEYVQNFDGSNDYTTQVISFPYSLPEGTVLAENSTAVQQMEYVKWLQTVWSDNSVSVTVYYRKEELPEIKEWLRKNYNDSVKTISFLLHSEHGFKQAPLEKITKEQYEEMVRTTRPILNAEGICYSAGDEKFVGEGECAGGACPLK